MNSDSPSPITQRTNPPFAVTRFRPTRCNRGFLVLTTALATLTAWSAEPPGQADDAGALIALEHRWVDALQKSDLEALSAILASTFVDTGETGDRGL